MFTRSPESSPIRRSRWGLLVFAAAGLAALAAAGEPEIVWEKDLPYYGLPSSFDAGPSGWRSPTMVYPQKFADADRIRSGEEFFQQEYGRACAFSEDWFKTEGYCSVPYQLENGAVVIKGGPKGFSFGFGPEPSDRERPALRFGAGWGRQLKDNFRARIELEQDAPETKWRFVPGSEKGYDFGFAKAFTIKGTGAVVFEGDIGLVRQCRSNPRIMFECETPNVTVKIRKLEIFPTSGEMFFRKSLTLAQPPVMARCSLRARVIWTLYVNGQQVDASPGVYPGGTLRNIDLAPYLKAGANLIAYEGQCVNWIGAQPELLFEGVAVDEAGTLTPILGDETWRCSLKREAGWEKPDFSDQAWAKPRLEKRGFETTQTDGRKVNIGIVPLPMGALEIAPEGRKYPVFESGVTPRFSAKLPAGLAAKTSLSLELCAGGTDQVLAKFSGSAPKIEGGLAVSTFELAEVAPGPYRLRWQLLDAEGKPRESQVGELIVAGPIPQDTLPLAKFEAELEKRLQPARQIDCAAEPKPEDVFVDHAGMYNRPDANRGKVVESGGLRYRETGPGRWDYFAYRLTGLELGQAYLAEIVIPDNADRCVYSGVVETYPADFCNNLARWGLGWFTATGSCLTGLNCPLTGKTRKLRYVFFPGSRNAAVLVMSGFSGAPAAACAVNIYRVDGGLPALQVPASDRLLGEHNERMSVMTLTAGMSETPLLNAKNYRLCPRRDGWFQLYKLFERKIQLLRYRGQNMSVEGAYMYVEGEFPSEKHCPDTSSDEMDPVYLLLKMYRQNGIKCLLGFEYIASPQVRLNGLEGVSDRRMRQGEASTRLVDRYGRQLVGYMNNGWNFLAPGIAATMRDCLGELYDRYGRDGEVAGLFLVNGYWWLPTFNTHAYPELNDLEVGYGDVTVGRFEQETGEKLGLDPHDPQRFEKRYAALTGARLEMWKLWRAKKIREFLGELSEVVTRGTDKWRLQVFNQLDVQTGSPFSDPRATREDRDDFFARRAAEFGLPLELYRDAAGLALTPKVCNLGKFAGTPEESYDPIYGLNRSASLKRAVADFDSVYVGHTNGLDEIDCPAGAAARTVFTRTTRGVFIVRGAEDNALAEFVEAVDGPRPPKFVFDGWHDCNMSTGFGEQQRRFAAAFYALPEAEFTPLPEAASRGIHAACAQADGAVWLRLINASPYPASGYFQTDAAKVSDAVYGGTPGNYPDDKQRYAVELRPNDIRLFRLEKPQAEIRCQCEFPAEVAAALRQDAQAVLADRSLLRKVPGDLIAALFAQLQAGDAGALRDTMENYEAIAQIRAARAARQALANQARLEQALKAGRARINCGCPRPYTAPGGEVWLPDQGLKEGVAAYGNLGGNPVDRGALKIDNTTAPRVYQTEIYGGRVQYRVPVPNGTYRLRLHFAETFVNNNRPGCRLISVAAEGQLHPDRIDPFQLAGGWAKPYVLELAAVRVFDQAIELELNGNVELNGLEIERAE